MNITFCRAEVLLGEILREFNRDEFYICTKVGRYMNAAAQTERYLNYCYSPLIHTKYKANPLINAGKAEFRE